MVDSRPLGEGECIFCRGVAHNKYYMLQNMVLHIPELEASTNWIQILRREEEENEQEEEGEDVKLQREFGRVTGVGGGIYII